MEPLSFTDIKEKLRQELSSYHQISDEELYQMIDHEVFALGEQQYLPLDRRLELRGRLYDSFRRLDILQELVDDPEITEIMVNGWDKIFVEKKGSILPWDRAFDSAEQLEDMIQQIVSRINRVVNVSSPIVDARLEDGSRVHVVLPPVALNGPIVTIRKFPEPVDIQRLIAWGSLTEEAAAFLEKLVRAGYNIFISGGTGSGKTSFLNALSAFIPENERIITIEDSAELQIRQIPNLVRLETRNGTEEGTVSIGDLIRAALRMRPDRILVGEVRGAECLDMLQAMNTGHDGSLSTGHGNNPADMLTRLETMVLMGADLPLAAIRNQIASALDIIVHLGRMRDKTRKVLSIMEVGSCEMGEIRLHPLYQFVETERGDKQENKSKRGRGGNEHEKAVEGSLKQSGELQNTRKLRTAGYTVS